MKPQLLILLTFLLIGCTTASPVNKASEPNTKLEKNSSQPNIYELEIDYFEGVVQFVNFNWEVTRYHIVGNDSVIDIKNDVHLRLVDDQINLPNKFKILAPLSAVSVVNGNLPSEQVKKYSLNYYIKIRENLYSKIKVSSSVTGKEKYINKENTELIFSFNLKQWEAYINQVITPDGWIKKYALFDTGSALISFNKEAGYIVTSQPYFKNNTDQIGRAHV